jgi:hypothetical protein
MKPLRTVDGLPAPGPDESWRELAEHSLDHDDADPARWRKTCPPPPGSPVVI